MALYSFSVHDKETGEYIRDNRNYDLAFLDFFALQFNNQEDLMRFLGIDKEKYDNILIEYANNRERKFLPLFFDAPELEEIVKKMVSFPDSEAYSSVYEKIALGYKYPNMVQVSDKLPDIDAIDKIVIRMRILDRDGRSVAEKAFMKGYLHEKALEFCEKGYARIFKEEMMTSYLKIRKAYMALRELEFVSRGWTRKKACTTTMEEVLDRRAMDSTNAYKILNTLELTPYEELLVYRVLNNSDESAYEELKSCSTDRLEYLGPIIKYLDMKRRNR